MAPQKLSKADLAMAAGNLARETATSNGASRVSVVAAQQPQEIGFRLPKPALMIAILVGMYVTIALAAQHNLGGPDNWVTKVRDVCYFHPIAAQFLGAIDQYVAQYVFFGHQKLALAFTAPAAVMAHVGEMLVAIYKMFQIRARYGAQVAGIVSIVLHSFAVFLFGFGSLGILNKEIKKLSATGKKN